MVEPVAIQLVRPLVQTSRRVVEKTQPSIVAIQEEEDLAGPAVYGFAWQVSNADEALFSNHEESRDGDNLRGQYIVLDADGTLRTVRYTVLGDEGFKVSHGLLIFSCIYLSFVKIKVIEYLLA